MVYIINYQIIKDYINILSMTGVAINNVSGYSRGYGTVTASDPNPAPDPGRWCECSDSIDVGDKIANAKGQILGQITNIVGANAIHLKDDHGGGLRVGVGDNEKLFKVTHTHVTINPRDGSMNCQSLYVNQDLLCVNGIAKFGSDSLRLDFTNDEGTLEIASQAKDCVIVYATADSNGNGTQKYRHGLDNSDSDTFKFEAVDTTSENDFGHSDHNRVMTVTTAGVLSLPTGDLPILPATTDVNIPQGVGLSFATDDAEKIEGDGTDLTVNSGGKINLTATSDVHLPNNIGLVFGDAGEKIEGDGTDLTIAGNNINLTAVADIVVPADVGITFGEKIEGDNTDLTVTSGGKINLTATSDVHLPNSVGLVFGDAGEKIEGDGTDLTIAGNNINLTAVADIVVPANVGITFGTGEKIEGDNTDLTVTSGADITLGKTLGC